MISCHLVYGLTIAVNVPLPGLPIRPVIENPDVRVRLKEWKSEFQSTPPNLPSNFLFISPNNDERGQPTLRVEMLADGRHFGFFYSDGARFAVARDGSEVWADWPENYTLEDACTYLVGPVIAFVLRLRGVTCLHASAIAVDNRAIVLLGLPGAGKSTTAAAFARLGYSILSDDVAVLDDQGDRFIVQPGYPRVNIWPDSVRALFDSDDALPHITPTWGKRFLALGRDDYRFESIALPLGAVYFLDEREDGLTVPVVEELTACEAFMTLVSNTYVNYLLSADMRSREFDVLGRLVAGVPVGRVRPTGDLSQMYLLCETITADARKFVNQDVAHT